MSKIVCFINSLSNGGAEVQICHLANQLIKKGNEVMMVTYADINDLRYLDPQVQRIRICSHSRQWIKFLGIFKFFLTIKADCVITYCQRNNFLALIPLCFRKIKVIAGERNFTVGKSTIFEKLLVNFLYYRADYIVPNSYSQRNHLLSLKPRWKNKIITIINYIDLNIYKYQVPPVNVLIEIGVFCRYDKQKNYIRLTQVVKRLVDSGYNNFIIRWYGLIRFKDLLPNPDYLEFKHLIQENGIENYFELNDFESNVVSKLRNFDVICVPSLYEGFSNSIAEAICSGKPMIVSDVSDNGVMVKEGVNGFLFNPIDEDSIYNAFVRLFNASKDEIYKMGKCSRQIAEELFHEEVFIDNYLRLIN